MAISPVDDFDSDDYSLARCKGENEGHEVETACADAKTTQQTFKKDQRKVERKAESRGEGVL